MKYERVKTFYSKHINIETSTIREMDLDKQRKIFDEL